MQVNRIQANNYSNQQNFKAKLRIYDMFGKVRVPEPKNTELIEKAKKIGLENDVIEFYFGGIKQKVENYWSPQDNFYIENWRTETSNKLKMIFTQEDKVKESFSETVYQIDYDNILDENENRIGEILDYLHTKYPNDIWA